MKTFKGGALRRHADRQYKIQGRPQNGRNGGNMPPGRAGGESGLALGVGIWLVAELKVPARFFDMGSELQVRALRCLSGGVLQMSSSRGRSTVHA